MPGFQTISREPQNGITYSSYWGDGSLHNWSAVGGDYGSLSPNVQGQLATETHGSSISTTYTYRGVGQSDRATASSSYFGNQTWTSDLLGVSTELNTAQSACPCYYIHDISGLLVEVIETTGSYFPVFDGDGSVIALTNSSGTVVDTWTYNPSGLTRPRRGPSTSPGSSRGSTWTRPVAPSPTRRPGTSSIARARGIARPAGWRAPGVSRIPSTTRSRPRAGTGTTTLARTPSTSATRTASAASPRAAGPVDHAAAISLGGFRIISATWSVALCPATTASKLG